MPTCTIDTDRHFTEFVAQAWQDPKSTEQGETHLLGAFGIRPADAGYEFESHFDLGQDLIIEQLDGSTPAFAVPTYCG
ncbi:hypothetical protein ABZT47_03405 [Sphaerisporangium sp. NPDC005289]|uniref:hypothetical protein n=1 Tax=Sphaerisporangium sp. NPDC005289 TaxID=3155247 RepID=UPI0033A4B212